MFYDFDDEEDRSLYEFRDQPSRRPSRDELLELRLSSSSPFFFQSTSPHACTLSDEIDTTPVSLTERTIVGEPVDHNQVTPEAWREPNTLEMDGGDTDRSELELSLSEEDDTTDRRALNRWQTTPQLLPSAWSPRMRKHELTFGRESADRGTKGGIMKERRGSEMGREWEDTVRSSIDVSWSKRRSYSERLVGGREEKKKVGKGRKRRRDDSWLRRSVSREEKEEHEKLLISLSTRNLVEMNRTEEEDDRMEWREENRMNGAEEKEREKEEVERVMREVAVWREKRKEEERKTRKIEEELRERDSEEDSTSTDNKPSIPSTIDHPPGKDLGSLPTAEDTSPSTNPNTTTKKTTSQFVLVPPATVTPSEHIDEEKEGDDGDNLSSEAAHDQNPGREADSPGGEESNRDADEVCDDCGNDDTSKRDSIDSGLPESSARMTFVPERNKMKERRTIPWKKYSGSVLRLCVCAGAIAGELWFLIR
ncbi:hypothetical protein BLNAU_19975 [Blattamonas nauphoetae]|uniref:Uncharacterized protein n=1 Tax=Blattamonas nauphoetae TaxID=2049346 RepID=A0ABQ9X024_9EUKA|nr:hypothetical protein BLNAU_19975 [Blattamonas nauphoetae]